MSDPLHQARRFGHSSSASEPCCQIRSDDSPIRVCPREPVIRGFIEPADAGDILNTTTALNIATGLNGHPGASVALIDGDREVTYGDLRNQVDSARQLLMSSGVSVGTRVLVIGENEVDFVVALYAALGAGATVVPIKAVNPFPEVQRKVAAVEPDVTLLCATADWLNERIDELVLGETFVVAEAVAAGDVATAPPIVMRDVDDIAVMLLTSGVTSDSKIAMLSHGNLDFVQGVFVADTEVGVTSDDVAYGVLPLTHIFGLNAVLFTTLRVGGRIVLEQRFEAMASLELVERHKITLISGAPPMWQRWALCDVDPSMMASVRYAVSGASALPIETFNAIRAKYGITLAEGYGLTETSPAVTWTRGFESRAGSVGKPLPGVEVILVDPDGTIVEEGDTGEVVVRSPGVFRGYLDSPEQTESVLTEDGWFWTGDVGVFDIDGYLYLVDRLKDIVIVSGFNVYPAEVESILLEHPEVRGAIVVGTPNALSGEAVVAHVSGEVSVDELDAFCRERLSRYKCPTEYHLVEELPVAANGKLLRRALRS